MGIKVDIWKKMYFVRATVPDLDDVCITVSVHPEPDPSYGELDLRATNMDTGDQRFYGSTPINSGLEIAKRMSAVAYARVEKSLELPELKDIDPFSDDKPKEKKLPNILSSEQQKNCWNVAKEVLEEIIKLEESQ